MNTATQTIELKRGDSGERLSPSYFASRNVWDWLFAALVIVGAGCGLRAVRWRPWMAMKKASCWAPCRCDLAGLVLATLACADGGRDGALLAGHLAVPNP